MADEAGQGCQSLASAASNYTQIDYGNTAPAGSCIALRAQDAGFSGAADSYFAFGTMSGNDWTGVTGSKGPFSTASSGACNEFTAAAEDFTAFDVIAGHYLAYYATADLNYALSGGPGYWSLLGNQTAGSGVTMTWGAGNDSSFGADITEAGGGILPAQVIIIS